jgi:molybdopterin/thiamine biosynthesis adenylyltransferase
MSDRYARHRQIPGWDQARIADAQVVIVGVGALGTEVARQLALAGVGSLVLCDGDTVAESNLSRGALFQPGDIGKPKAMAAAQALRLLRPDMAVIPRQSWLVPGVGLAELRDATLVISCLDSPGSRAQLAMRCGLAGAAMLDGGTQPWGGEVRFFPVGGACYGCGLTSRERAVREKGLSCANAALSGGGASAAVSALIASWLTTTALRLILRLPVGIGFLRVDAAIGDAQRLASPPRDPNCPLHTPIAQDQVKHSLLTCDATVGDLLGQLGPDESALGWTEFAGLTRPFSVWLSDAPPTSRLRDIGVAPREIIRIIARRNGRPDRYLELTGGVLYGLE